MPWLEAEHPEAFLQLFATDGFNFSEANGRLIAKLMNQWQEEKGVK